MRPFVMISALALLVCLFLGRTGSASEWSDPEWRADYSKAMSDAERDGRMMLIVFCARGDATQCDCLAPDVLANPEVRQRLESFVRVRVPLGETISVSGKSIRLLDIRRLPRCSAAKESRFSILSTRIRLIMEASSAHFRC